MTCLLVYTFQIKSADDNFFPFFIYLNVCVCVSHPVVSNSLRPHGLQPARLLCPWNSPGKNTGVDYHPLLQSNFPTQGQTLVSCIAGKFFTIWATGKSVDLSTSLELTQMHSFLWLCNIPLCVYIPQLLYSYICQWTSRLLPCSSYCK